MCSSAVMNICLHPTYSNVFNSFKYSMNTQTILKYCDILSILFFSNQFQVFLEQMSIVLAVTNSCGENLVA